MKTHILTGLFALVFAGLGIGIQYKAVDQKSTLELKGTSTLHDWEMQAQEINSTLSVSTHEDDFTIESLHLNVPVIKIKSGNSVMDKNTYKALKEDDYHNITYNMIKVTNVYKDNSQYVLSTIGNLTIAGKTKEMPIKMIAKVNNGSVNLTGKVSFKMTDFNVTPPELFMGTLKTGDDITVEFNLLYQKSTNNI